VDKAIHKKEIKRKRRRVLRREAEDQRMHKM